MTPRQRTETPNPASMSLGSLSPRDVITLMAAEDTAVMDAVACVTEGLTVVAEHVAASYLAGCRTILVGAGTSGRLALQEVSELPPTFGVAAHQFVAFLASKAPVGPAAIATTEDDTDAIRGALDEAAVGAGDTVIGIAASGRTPFVVAAVEHARRRGAWCAALTNNPDTPLAATANASVLLDTGPEVLTGSTRLKAGTAQKVALNRITTAAMVAAGRVTGNHMTELIGTNSKLRARCISILGDLRGIAPADAEAALVAAQWRVRDALRLIDGAATDIP